jgi:hypothetical protein
VNANLGKATDVLERLIRRMRDQSGPVEEVIGQWTGPEVEVAAASGLGARRVMAMAVVEELGSSWGASGDPTWVDGLVPGRDDDGREVDYMFALYRRPQVYAYARLRGDSGDPPTFMRMILGVLRKPQDHRD